MFNVQNKETGEIKTVFAINGTMFLMWNEDEGCWYYAYQDEFRPVAEVDTFIHMGKIDLKNYMGVKT